MLRDESFNIMAVQDLAPSKDLTDLPVCFIAPTNSEMGKDRHQELLGGAFLRMDQGDPEGALPGTTAENNEWRELVGAA